MASGVGAGRRAAGARRTSLARGVRRRREARHGAASEAVRPVAGSRGASAGAHDRGAHGRCAGPRRAGVSADGGLSGRLQPLVWRSTYFVSSNTASMGSTTE